MQRKIPAGRERAKQPRKIIKQTQQQAQDPVPCSQREALESLIAGYTKGLVRFRQSALPDCFHRHETAKIIRLKPARGALTVENLIQILHLQDNKCYYTGLNLYPFPMDAPEYFNAIGIELIERRLGLRKANVRAVCWSIGVAKQMIKQSGEKFTYFIGRPGLNLRLTRKWFTELEPHPVLHAMVQLVFDALGADARLEPYPLWVTLDNGCMVILNGYYCHPDTHTLQMFKFGSIYLDPVDALVKIRPTYTNWDRPYNNEICVPLNRPDFDKLLVDGVISILGKSYRDEAENRVGIYKKDVS